MRAHLHRTESEPGRGLEDLADALGLRLQRPGARRGQVLPRLDVTVETWEDLSPTRTRALEAQAERVGEILEATPRLTLGPVQVGPHA